MDFAPTIVKLFRQGRSAYDLIRLYSYKFNQLDGKPNESLLNPRSIFSNKSKGGSLGFFDEMFMNLPKSEAPDFYETIEQREKQVQQEKKEAYDQKMLKSKEYETAREFGKLIKFSSRILENDKLKALADFLHERLSDWRRWVVVLEKNTEKFINEYFYDYFHEIAPDDKDPLAFIKENFPLFYNYSLEKGYIRVST